ncbi:hypothetical protein HDU96_007488 [Phlyctochytrium bullatum]|nr:hypothetical protein HDU96_007488 [Phlyctochytrium bullatum]
MTWPCPDDFETAPEYLSHTINVEKAVVTTRQLSRTLRITMSEAQKAMESFANLNKDHVHACYLVYGIITKQSEDESVPVREFCLVQQEELESAKTRYKNADVKVFSLQPARLKRDQEKKLQAQEIKAKKEEERNKKLDKLRSQEVVAALQHKEAHEQLTQMFDVDDEEETAVDPTVSRTSTEPAAHVPVPEGGADKEHIPKTLPESED